MRCSFCGSDIAKGTGKMFVKNTGEIFYFDKSKCENNFSMGRDKKKIKWVKREKKIKKR
ncbi:MAG: 50S ribosomal protein L24e [Candidatus Aenigmarchaeota archaeon]|nr:50S ribosomal protein L24e [Candidatus Aenigmarchaeota archaeon]